MRNNILMLLMILNIIFLGFIYVDNQKCKAELVQQSLQTSVPDTLYQEGLGHGYSQENATPNLPIRISDKDNSEDNKYVISVATKNCKNSKNFETCINEYGVTK